MSDTDFLTKFHFGISTDSPLLELLTTPVFGILVVLSAFIFASTWFFRSTRKVRQRIKLSREAIRQNSDIENPARRFRELDASLSSETRLGSVWREFVSESIAIEPQGTAVRSYIDPRLILTTSNTIPVWINLRFFQAVPGYLLTIGLVLTFVGLLVALDSAAGALQNSDSGSQLRTLENLLRAASFKFVASIFGLFSSIVFSIWFNLAMRRFDRMLADLGNELAGCLVPTSSNQLVGTAVDVVRELPVHVSRQIAPLLAEPVSALREAVDKLGSDMANANVDALQQISSAFGKDLVAAAQPQIDRLAQSIGDLSDRLNAFESTIGQAAERSAATLDGSAQRLAKHADSLGTVLDRAGRESAANMSNAIGSASSTLVSATKEAGQSIESGLLATVAQSRDLLSQLPEQTERAATQMRGAVEGLQSSSRELNKAAEKLGPLSSELQSASGALAGSAAPIADSVQALGEQVQHLRKHGERLSSLETQMLAASDRAERVWSAYAEHFAGIDKELSRVFASLEKALGEYQRAMSASMNTLDRDAARVASLLDGRIEELERRMSTTDSK